MEGIISETKSIIGSGLVYEHTIQLLFAQKWIYIRATLINTVLYCVLYYM